MIQLHALPPLPSIQLRDPIVPILGSSVYRSLIIHLLTFQLVASPSCTNISPYLCQPECGSPHVVSLRVQTPTSNSCCLLYRAPLHQPVGLPLCWHFYALEQMYVFLVFLGEIEFGDRHAKVSSASKLYLVLCQCLSF